MMKDTQVVGTELADTNGNTLHVMSTEATTVATGLSSLDSDNNFVELQSVSITTPSGGSLTLGLSGFARTGGDVTLFTTSAAVPTLTLSGTTLSLGADASATALAAIGAGNAGNASTGGRMLTTESGCSAGSNCASFKVFVNGQVKCPAGTYKEKINNADRCSTCKTNQYLNHINCASNPPNTVFCHTSTACTAIPLGAYGTYGIHSIGTANANWAVTSGTALESKLGAGLQKIAYCSAGTYARTNRFADCVTVPVGKYCSPPSTLGSTCASPVDCSPGSTCAGGTFAPVACSGGYYAQSLSTCVQCTTSNVPVGKYCSRSANGKSSSVGPVDCPPGYTCAGGNADAVPCPAGYFCKGGAAVAVKCVTLNTIAGENYGGNGYRSKAGSSHCCNTCDYKISSLPDRVSDPSASVEASAESYLGGTNKDNVAEAFGYACIPGNRTLFPDASYDMPNAAMNPYVRVELTLNCKTG